MQNAMSIKCLYPSVVLVCLFFLILSCNKQADYGVYSLKINGMECPQGIDETPVFEWKLYSLRKGVYQKCYRIKVYGEDGAKVWDSGKVTDKHPFQVTYQGAPLQSNTFYRWEVVSTDNQGYEAKAESTFSTGLLSASDWTAKWIAFTGDRKPFERPGRDQIIAEILHLPGLPSFIPEKDLDAPIYLRKVFSVGKNLRRAVAYVTAHGIYSLLLNGKEVGEPLAPGITTYPHFLEVQQYDITSVLNLGENVLGAILADGWWSGKLSVHAIGEQFGRDNALLCQLMLEYEDGSCETIGSDASFKWNNNGPLLYADLTEGEHYDANRELKGWMLPGYDDVEWSPVREMDYGYGNLAGRKAPAVKVVREIPAKRILNTPDGQMVVDFGENLAGRVRATLHGKAGQTVILDHQEMLDKDGNLLYSMRGRCRNQRTKYTFSEDGTVVFTPSFSLQGFQYVAVSGLDEVRADDFVAEVLATDLDTAGEFKCSDPALNRLQENIFRSQRSNMISIPTDCPQREKMGWTCDMQVFAPTACYNMDVKAFLSKWLVNMRFDQADSGSIPDVTPILPIFQATSDGNGRAGWGDACILVPWALYQEYGNAQILKDNYEMMEKWLAFVSSETTDFLWDKDRFQYGDWLVPNVPERYRSLGAGRTTYNVGQDEVATAMYYRSTCLFAQISQILGFRDKYDFYQGEAEKIRASFCDRYVHEDGTMDIDMQGLYVLVLGLDLVQGEVRERMAMHLADLVQENGYRLNTGFVSTPLLMDVLADIDTELAMRVLFQTDVPSWLYEVEKGATTLWESWDQIQADGTVREGSFNHFAYGCVGDFLYRRILGIGHDAPGYEEIEVEPLIPANLDWAEGWHETPFGRISLRWERSESGIRVMITVPPGCMAILNVGGQAVKVTSGAHTMVIHPHLDKTATD